MNISQYLEELIKSGKYCFTKGELERALDCSSIAARDAIRRQKKKGALATPVRGFHIIVTPEHRSVGCLPAIQLTQLLMKHLELDYYVGLLSAAELYGVAHQRPQVFQVVVAKNRRSITCGKVRLRFVARRNVERMPTQLWNTPRGYAVIGTLESTAIDLVGYPKRSGGFSNVATILTEMAEKIDGALLVEVARQSPVSWAQRLGYLLDYVGLKTTANDLASYVKSAAKNYVSLASWRDASNASRNSRWKLLENERIEADL